MSNTPGRGRVTRAAATLIAATATAVALVVAAPAASAAPAKGPQIRISGGDQYAAAVDAKGRVYTWGHNWEGQPGLGKKLFHKDQPKPVRPTKGAAKKVRFIDVAAGTGSTTAQGTATTVAVGRNGALYQWGKIPAYTGPRSGKPEYLYTPTKVPGAPKGVKFIAVSGGYSHFLALSRDGRIYAWGNNKYGQLGDGTQVNRSKPMRIVDGEAAGVTFTAMSAGLNHVRALGSNGKLYAWGSNAHYQLGDGTHTDRAAPVLVSALKLKGAAIATFAAGTGYSLVVDSRGRLYSWGTNSFGEIGNGTQWGTQKTPVLADTSALGKAQIIALATGTDAAYALASNGRLYSWGSSLYGQLGSGNWAEPHVPRPVKAAGMAAR